VLCVHAGYGQSRYASSGLADPQTGQLDRVLLVFTIALITLAAVNAILITWATVLDTRHPSALTRALGATPGQVAAGLTAAQALPALAGSLLGIPGGIELFAAVSKTGAVTAPPAWWLIAAVAGTLAAVAALTAARAWLGTRRHFISGVLQAELA
jgi:ABC-type lipoprotein release transport system permease subunit